MDQERPNDRDHLIEFIAATVEAMRAEMGAMRGEMATKSGLAAEVTALRGEMATKSGLAAEVTALRGEMATIQREMATKGDLARLEEKMDAGFTAVRGDIERVALRLDQVDKKQTLRSTAIETDVSRLRSVVYVLVKDQPDLVRMLG